MTFEQVFDRVLGHEGEYVNNKKDPGGETKWGISKRSFPWVDIKNLTRTGALLIYKKYFWDVLDADKLPDGVIYQLTDYAVNSGIPPAIKALQRTVGAKPDGIWGPKSQESADKTSETDMIMLILAERLELMTSLKNWPDAGKGWARRIAQNLRYGAEDS